MYGPLLLIHSWTRWFLVIATLYFIFRALRGWRGRQQWQASDTRFIWAYGQVFGYQFLFGLMLWIGFSPFSKAGFMNPASILSDPVVNFWAFRHPLTMFAAIGVFHFADGKVKDSLVAETNSTERFRIYALAFIAIAILFATAIPWPGLLYGRDLLRGFL